MEPKSRTRRFSLFQRQAGGVTTTVTLLQNRRVHTYRWPSSSARCPGAFRGRAFPRQVFLKRYSSCISGEFSWFFAHSIYCTHRYLYIAYMDFVGTRTSRSWGRVKDCQSGVENPAHGVLHHVCGHIFRFRWFKFSVSGVLNSTQNILKNCLKKILITVKIFLKNQNNYVHPCQS